MYVIQLPASTGSTTTTTVPGAVITVVGGPNATANIPGPSDDQADFWGIFVVVAAILVTIILARLLFYRKRR